MKAPSKTVTSFRLRDGRLIKFSSDPRTLRETISGLTADEVRQYEEWVKSGSGPGGPDFLEACTFIDIEKLPL